MDSFLRARASKQLIASVNRRAAKLGLKRSEFIRLTLALAVEGPTTGETMPTRPTTGGQVKSEVPNVGDK